MTLNHLFLSSNIYKSKCMLYINHFIRKNSLLPELFQILFSFEKYTNIATNQLHIKNPFFLEDVSLVK